MPSRRVQLNAVQTLALGFAALILLGRAVHRGVRLLCHGAGAL